MQYLIDQIKQHEGFSSKVYVDTEGYSTIGYGFAIKDLELDEDIAEEILARNLTKLISRVRKTFDWYDSMPEEIQDVVINMCYNLGIKGYSKFKKHIKYLKEHNWELASDEMLDSLWAKQVKTRANDLSNIVRNCTAK